MTGLGASSAVPNSTSANRSPAWPAGPVHRRHRSCEHWLPVPNGKITVSLTDAQGLLLCSQNGALRQVKVGQISLGLELPLLPLNPGEYILSCTISDGIHPLAFLRATPELTVLEEQNATSTGYHGVLNLPTRLSVEEDPP